MGPRIGGAQRLQGRTELSESGLLCLAEVVDGADIDQPAVRPLPAKSSSAAANSSSLTPNTSHEQLGERHRHRSS